MICSRCQAQLPDDAKVCRWCNAVQRDSALVSTAATPESAVAAITIPSTLVTRPCPTCQTQVTINLAHDVRCPQCNVSFPGWWLEQIRSPHAPSSIACSGAAPASTVTPSVHRVDARDIRVGGPAHRVLTQPGSAALANGSTVERQARHAAMELEGVVQSITNPPLMERRDVDVLQAFVAVLFLIDAVALAVVVGTVALTIFLVLLVLTFIANRVLGHLLPAAFGPIIQQPLAVLGAGWQLVRDAFSPPDTDMEPVREVALAVSGQVEPEIFWIKGAVAPHTPFLGERLRHVRLQQRGARRYFVGGQFGVEEAGRANWRSMRLQQPRRGLRWLMAWLAFNGGSLAVWLLVFRR